MNKYSVYVLTYKNEQRKENMIERFNKLGIEVTVTEGYNIEDLSSIVEDWSDHKYRTWSQMESHLVNIKQFYETGDEYGIFCEDDIFISKDFKQRINNIITDCSNLNLDIVLLGHLLYTHPKESWCCKQYVENYYSYDNDLWGAHCYLLTRKYARVLLDYYSIKWAIENPSSPYCSDWTITKLSTKRVLVFPPLAVEEGIVVTDHQGQVDFHRNCTQYQLTTGEFI